MKATLTVSLTKIIQIIIGDVLIIRMYNLGLTINFPLIEIMIILRILGNKTVQAQRFRTKVEHSIPIVVLTYTRSLNIINKLILKTRQNRP